MENSHEDGLAETPKALPTSKSRTVKSVGLRRRTPRDSSLAPFATTNAMAASKVAEKMDVAVPKNVENNTDDDESRDSEDSSFLMTSVDWDLLEADTTKEKPLGGLDEMSYSSLSSSMLTPGDGLKPLEVDKLNTLERCTLLPAEGSKMEYVSPESGPVAETSKSKVNSTSVPKKLFESNEDAAASGDEGDLNKSPIITYKRRIPQNRPDLKCDKRLKPSSPLKPAVNSALVPQASHCSTPVSQKSKPPLINQSPIKTDSEDDDSLLFEFCDEIEKSVQKEKVPVVKTEAPAPALAGFSTASGSRIAVSDEAREAAETLLAFFMAENIPND